MAQPDIQERLEKALGNKYRVLCHIGGGGMAEVYLVQNLFLESLCAVKVLAEHLANERNIVGRFEREARTAAKLARHPNIVQIFDIDKGNGLNYFVMQFVAGEDLKNLLKREGHLPPTAAANVIAQAVEALSFAEEKSIIHRDLKPANMLLDEDGRIKLVDFGISKVYDASSDLTRPGEVPGSPPYMSPEQIRGHECDTRSDLYSLGVVFFELLTGKRPFEKETATATFEAHLSEPPPSLLTLDMAVPAEYDAVVQKLLKKHAEERHQSTSELLNDLVSLGVSSRPGMLRPCVDPRIQKAIAQSQQSVRAEKKLNDTLLDYPLVRPTSAGESIQTSSGTEGTYPDLKSHTTRTNTSNRKSSDNETPQKSRLRMWMVFLVCTGLLLGIVSAAPAIWRRLVDLIRPPVLPTPAKLALPRVYSDARGRMLLVPAGAFSFETSSQPEKQVVLSAFYIDEAEVSNAQYRRFCDATGHAPPRSSTFSTRPDYPVSGVSYADASAYASWAGARLPTEEEWEKAARGTDRRQFPWGSIPWTSNIPDDVQPVISGAAHRSPYGAYNMAGNVSEWTATPFTPTQDDSAKMKQLLRSQRFSSDWRVIKGGSFAPRQSEEFDIRKHRGLPIDQWSAWVGFRCVRNAPSVH